MSRAIATLLFLVLVGVQIFGSRPIGVADNNDFPKVLGRFHVWVAPEFRADEHNYFVTDYRVDEAHTWDSGLPTSEYLIAWMAIRVSSVFLTPGSFDMRFMGGIQALIAAFAMWLFFRTLDSWPWVPRAAFILILLLVFADVEYVQLFSTAYMDAGSMIFLMVVFAIGWNVALDKEKANWRWGLLFSVFGVLFLGTKVQHEPCLIPLAAFSLAVAITAHTPAGRLVWLIAPVAFSAVAWFMVARTPPEYMAESEFSLVFTKLVPLSQNPESALGELGRPATDIVYSHLNAYSEGSPLTIPAYKAKFLDDVGTGKIVAFYFRHPGILFEVLRSDFLAYAPDIPMGNFGTMRRADYPAPVYRAEGLKLWSTLRRESSLRWPWLIPLLYIIVPLASFETRTSLTGLFALAVAAIGCLSFAAGSLADATETMRHTLLYQEATDMLCLIALFTLARRFWTSYSR